MKESIKPNNEEKSIGRYTLKITPSGIQIINEDNLVISEVKGEFGNPGNSPNFLEKFRQHTSIHELLHPLAFELYRIIFDQDCTNVFDEKVERIIGALNFYYSKSILVQSILHFILLCLEVKLSAEI